MDDEMNGRDAPPRRGRANFQVVDATTEEDIRRHLAEDGFDPDNPLEGLVEVLSPAEIRRRAGLTQPDMAEHLHIPVATWRNWEQGRTTLDPAIRSFLNALSRDPEYIFRLIGGRDLPDWCNGQLNRMLAQNDVEFLISLVSTPASFDEMPIPYEAARLRRIQGETRFDAVFDAMRKRRVA